MHIHGLQKLAMVDYPGKLAATVFTGGCNLRCPFCHNALLVTRLAETPEIPEQEVLDFRLRTGDDLDEETLARLKAAAGASGVRTKAAELIGKRAMSRRDLERKLQEKGASQAEARYAAEWLEAIGAINDADYAAILVRHCAGLGYGPARIREKLREKGVPRELWDEALDQAPDSAWQIDRFLAAKLRGRAPEEAEKRRLTSALLRRGFAWGDVREAWSRLGAEILEE